MKGLPSAMMGAHHAACGAAAWVALTTQVHLNLEPVLDQIPFLPHGLGPDLFNVGPAGIIAGAIVTAGAALVPDADHHNATIAHSLPPVSNAVCSGIGKVSGGHRHGTHSVVGIVAFVFLAWLAGLWSMNLQPFGVIYPGAGILSVLLVAFAAKALKIIPDTMRKFPWVVGLAVGVFITFFAPHEQGWFPVAMAVGVIVHILGDMLTIGGCNLVWPAVIKPPRFLGHIPVLRGIWKRNGYFAIPILGHAGSTREWVMLVPIGLYAIVGVGSAILGLSQHGLQTMAGAMGIG